MANEITINATLEYADSEGESESLQVTDLLATVSTKKFTKMKQNIGTSEEAIGLGEIAAPGWALFINRDLTNYIELRVGTGGAKFATLYPGKIALLYLGAGAQVPYAIANTGACQMVYFICSQ